MLHQKKHTIPSIDHDFREWHLGRSEFTVWMIHLEHPAVHEKVAAARKHLSEYLLVPYDRQPHITLFVCGFLAETSRHHDDYGRKQFDEHRRLLKNSKIGPFSIEIGGLNSFASAPFLEVHDREGGIEQVRTVLCSSAREIERDIYTPHVTLGLYSGIYESKTVLDRMSSFSSDPVSVLVDRITFAAFEASTLVGPLTYKQQIVLE